MNVLVQFKQSKTCITHLFTRSCQYYIILIITLQTAFLIPQECNANSQTSQQVRPWDTLTTAVAQAHDSFIEPPTLKPSLLLVLPQSLKVPNNPNQADDPTISDQTRLQQYVAVINNAQNRQEDQLLRQRYEKLSLQVRDASQAITGQLFYEHVFEYFPTDKSEQHLLIPINLDQVSLSPNQVISSTSDRASARYLSTFRAIGGDLASYASIARTPSGNNFTRAGVVEKLQQVIISIRPHETDTGFGNDNVEFVSSAPILLESVPSSDGRRSFSVVQTDKPIYKPDEKVRIRALVVNENLRPLVRDEFRLQIRNPQKVVVEEVRFPRPQSQNPSSNEEFSVPIREPLFVDHVFSFSPEPMLGTWSAHLLHNDPIANDTTSFEVKEYMLPPFEIQFESPRYILPNTSLISGGITAKYHYGKPVHGKVVFKFGIKKSPSSLPEYVARSSIKTIDPTTGRAEYKFVPDRFKKFSWFPEIAGSRLTIEATITETSTGHLETALDSSCAFVMTPYRLSFEDSIVDFKLGSRQPLSVQLIDSLTHQAGPPGQRITASYWNKDGTSLTSIDRNGTYDIEATTDHLGRAIFNIWPMKNDTEEIVVSLKLIGEVSSENPSNTDKHHKIHPMILASREHRLTRFQSHIGWVQIANKTITHTNIGDEFVSDIVFQPDIVLNKTYYLITSRGHIMLLGTLSDGLIRFTITESMMPSFRLVLFTITHSSDRVLSDSMRINVGQDMNCGLSLDYVSKDKLSGGQGTYRPNDSGELTIRARYGDLVSLIGVDSAVYALNNRTRLDSLRIIERIKRLDLGCGFGGGQSNLDVFHNAGLMLFGSGIHADGDKSTSSYVGSSCLTTQNRLRYLDDVNMGYTKPIFTHIGSRTLSGARTKREVNIEGMLNRYKNPIHRACCRLGTLEDTPQNRNCSTRARIVHRYMHLQAHSEFKSCAVIYELCCSHVSGPSIRLGTLAVAQEGRITPRIVEPQHSPPFSAPPSGQLNQIEADTLIRKDFRETWLFELVPVSDQGGVATLDVQLPHTITSWTISAMALNQYKPMCIMPQPYKIISFQEMFIQIAMPYKVVQGEQIDLVAKLFNYSPDTQDVLVYMYGVDDVCSEAEPDERSERKRVRIEKHSTQSILFPMIPLKTGKYPIKIVAISLNSNSSDIVERQLNVVPRGKPVTDETTFSLDPMNQQRRSKRAIQTGNLVDEIDSARGLQRSRVRLAPSRDSDYIVPQTHECIVSAIGDKLGQAVQTTILDVENLIRLPHGCGEQVMIYLGPTLYTAKYLSDTNRLTGDTRWRAIRYIQSGYKRILNFRKENGAFSAFANRSPSIWLTAFVTRLLCQTERTSFIADEVHVDKTVINSALTYLLDTQDKTTGQWLELNPVYHREILGGTLRENVLTAFVIVSLNECAHHSLDLVEEVPIERENPDNEQVSSPNHLLQQQTNGVDRFTIAMRRAEQTLTTNRLNAVKDKNPYALALVAHALSYSNPQEASLAVNDLLALAERSQSRNQVYWRGDYQIETAAYALQALMSLAPYIAARDKRSGPKLNLAPGADAVAIANWLTSQRSYTGAFESTQDTIVALEALSKFAQIQSTVTLPGGGQSSPKLMCNVTVNNRTKRSIEFGEDNASILQTFKLDPFDLDSINGEMLDIITSGSGLGTMSVKLKYNVFQEEDDLCRFDIDSSIEEWQPAISSISREKNNHRNDYYNAYADVPIDNQSNDTTFDDDYFKTFDKSMLSELNLIDHPEHSDSIQSGPGRSTTIRLKRSTSSNVTTESSANDSNKSWTAKIVSKFSSWISPRHPTEKQNSAIVSVPKNISMVTTGHDSDSLRKSGPSRRSAHPNVAPLINLPASIHPGAHLNNLSEQLEISANSSKISNSNSSTSYVLSANELSHRLVLLLRVCVHHMARRDSEMSVIEIGILSGFKPNEADLKMIIDESGTPAMKYELSPDRSLIIIYMQHIPNSGPYCFQFRLVRDSLVYNLQSGYIRVYEYYSPKHSCSNFYTPARVTDLIRTKCDSSGQVCQCASRSLCPATNKLVSLSDVHQVNATSARSQLIDLICSNKFDLVSLVRLKSVRHMEVGKIFKLSVKVKTDLKGNLTKIVEAQRLQKNQSLNSLRKPQHSTITLSDNANPTDPTNIGSAEDFSGIDDTSLDLLSMSIESGCVRDDPYLLHLAHPNQWKQGGELMILFARSNKIEKRLFRTSSKRSLPSRSQQLGPRPKPNVWGGKDNAAASTNTDQQQESLIFDDAQQLQYSLLLELDKDSILHDLTYQAKVGSREALNNLILWLELRSRRERWSCPAFN